MKEKTAKKAMPWKAPEDVEWVRFSQDEKGDPITLGSGKFGTVYVGRMRFKDGALHRVAVKRFRNPEYLSPFVVGRYQKAIGDLTAAGVRLPKMDFVKLSKGTPFGSQRLEDDEYVQVSQLFGSSKKGTTFKEYLLIPSAKGRMHAVEELTRVANAGYCPSLDFFFTFTDTRKGVIPFDIDGIVYRGKQDPVTRAEYLIGALKNTQADIFSKDEFNLLTKRALAVASDEMKGPIKREASKPP